jgi:two-component system sensor histidine kinase HydH
MLIRRSTLSHTLVTVAGGLVILCLALVWRASVRLVETQGRARVLETETRHLRELSQAAAGLAHETRNPLSLIRGWTQRFADSQMAGSDRQEHTRAVIEECDRVTARINQFLAFARPCEPAAAEIEVCAIVDELTVILQPDLELKELTIRCQDESACKAIRGDRELFRQAMFNLIQNAIQFAPPGDTISVSIRATSGGQYRIDVSDRGPGVADEAIRSLFTPYYTTRPDGTGLGLAIVRRIAMAHGWEANYASRPGGGAVFSLEGIHG